MKLEEGKCYVSADGKVFGPLHHCRVSGSGYMAWEGETDRWVTKNGRHEFRPSKDLITEHRPKPLCKVCGRPTGGCCTVMVQPDIHIVGDATPGETSALVDLVSKAYEAHRSQPKPRLGDYYAGLSEDDFDELWQSSRELWRIGYWLFQESAPLEGNPLSFSHWVEASDAFAFGGQKYGVGTWRDLSSDDHFQGAGRHFKAWLDDPESLDPESKLPHRKHFLARAIMCLEMRRVGR